MTNPTKVITINEKDTAFDPLHISTIYGLVDAERITDVSVGTKIGKMFSSGDAGCGSKIVQLALTPTKTLTIFFSDCDDGTDRALFYTQTELIQSILSTFTFTK